MSDTKHEELIASGQLAGDGSRIARCPTCGQDLPEGFELEGAAIETVETEVEQ